MQSQDSVSWFLNQAGRVPLLTHEEELLLGRSVQEWLALEIEGSPTPEQKRIIRRGQKAKDRMFNANLRLVVSIAKRYTRAVTKLELADLIQEGCIGLNRAIEKFDPARGYKFSTYSYWWIRQGITRAINQLERTIRLPINATEQINKLRAWLPKFKAENGRPPTPEECMELMGLKDKAALRNYLEHMEGVRSLDVIANMGEGSAIIDLLCNDDDTPMEVLEVTDGVEHVRNWLEVLTDKQRNVIEMRYGLTGKDPQVQVKVSEALGVSRQYIQQQEKAALTKMRLHACVGGRAA